MRKLFSFRLPKQAAIWKVICLSIFLGQAFMLKAQTIDFTACNTTSTLPSKVAGADIGTITITASNTPGGASATMDINRVAYEVLGFETEACNDLTATQCNSPFVTTTGLTITATGGTVTITGTPTLAAVGTTIIIDIVATAAGTPCKGTFRLPIVRKPADIVLVLDKSGSMGGLSGTSGVTRWNALITAVGLFMTNLEGVDLADDKIGLTFFDGAAVQPPSGFPTPLISTTGSTSAVNGNFSTVTPGGSTAFGAGLQNGLSKMTFSTSRNRFLIAFTDGEQNVPTTSFVNVGGDDHVYLGAARLSTDPVRIYPIGIGAAGSLPAVLNDITQSAEGSNGLQISTENGSGGSYASSFLSVLADVLKTGSPQIVDVRQGRFTTPVSNAATNFGGFQSQDSFVVNKKINKIIFNVISDAPKGFTIYSVKKGAMEFFPSLGKLDTGRGYRSFAVTLGLPGMPAITSEGVWTVRARSFSQDPYEISVVVDDHGINYDLNLGNKRQKVGTPIDITSHVRFGINPIKNATVQAFILKPGDDLGDLLATTSADVGGGSPTDPSSVGVLKYEALIKDSNFLKKLLPKEQIITLSYNAGDSSYKGQFSATDVSGVYQVILRIKTPDDSVYGTVERFQRKSIYVYFPDVDLKQSNVTMTINAGGLSVLNFRPKAGNGKFIGPGWASMIKLDSSAASIQQIVDHGDGSYSITFSGDVNSTGVISIGGETVYSGKISDIGKAGGGGEIWKQWWFWLVLLLIIIIIIIVVRKK